MKNLTGYLVAATLALGATLVAIDAHAAVVCGQNGCRHVYPHRSQWPVGGAHPAHWQNSLAVACRHVTREDEGRLMPILRELFIATDSGCLTAAQWSAANRLCH
jgi:hypothetical protein